MKVQISDGFFKLPIAHRGLHGGQTVENSLDAFRAAVQNGFGIEIDVHLLKDEELAVVHDSDLTRLTGQSVRVEDLTKDQLKNYPLNGIKNNKIPTFSETKQVVQGKVPLLIELKFDGEFDPRLPDILLSQLDGYSGEVCLQSFHPAAVRYLKRKTSRYAVGQLSGKKLKLSGIPLYLMKTLKILHYSRADFIAYDIEGLPDIRVERLRRKGFPVFAWTVDSAEKLQIAKNTADQIIFEKILP